MCKENVLNPVLVSPLARKQLLYSFLTVFAIDPKSPSTFQAAGAVVVCYDNEVITLDDLAARIMGNCNSSHLEQFAQEVAIQVKTLCQSLSEHEAVALQTITFFEDYHKAAYA